MSRIEQLIAQSRTVLDQCSLHTRRHPPFQVDAITVLILVNKALLAAVEELHLHVQYLETYTVEVGYAPGRDAWESHEGTPSTAQGEMGTL